MIKYYSWEAPYLAQMTNYRNKESKAIFKLQIIRNILFSVAFALPILTSMAAFCVLFAVNKGRVSAGSIFSSLSWFAALANLFMMVPMAAGMMVDASVALGRAAEFFSQGEINPNDDYQVLDLPNNAAIKLENASFEWHEFDLEDDKDDDKKKNKRSFLKLFQKKSVSEADSSTGDEKDASNKNGKVLDSADIEVSDSSKKFLGLHNINLEIKQGEFVVITGSIGSGKSSLLAAISGTMTKLEGDASVKGSLLSCGYPWVQNASVRENITFGLPYDEEKYDKVISCCSLNDDFEQLPGGDMTQVGERGITLSGGQRARINLARAVYAGKDIILMDDVLSAVDAKVGKHIIDSCIMDYLKEKTRVLATHQLHLIGSADKVIFLNGDGSIDVGSFEDLKSRNSGFNTLIQHASELIKESDSKTGEISKKEDALVDVKTTTLTANKDFKITEEEERAVNVIGMDVIMSYIKYASGFFKFTFFPLLILSVAVFVFFTIFANTWLSFWVSYKFNDRSDNFYRALYIVFSFIAVITTLISLCMIVYGTITSSKKLNLRATQRFMYVPMSYIDVTPLGRILNRFSKDTDVLDNEITLELQQFITFAET
ncbi:unnamed protein product [Ambrosiozyma monospora]|uniref:Unnamed protein product n=1 Tax=Ambrosiozyma monospora TaxID=43982 RepID=A0ACB5T5N8_AMBMO|nr:unnamed protein product [Ambrosiozyma monospora]